jgi:hypothetical protein
VYLTTTNPTAGNVNFAASYVPTPVTLTALITEVVVDPVAIPTNAVIAPPSLPNGTVNLITVGFMITSTDPTFAPRIMTATAGSGVVQFTGLLDTEPADGSCSRTFSVTVLSVQPPYLNQVAWQIIPMSKMQMVTLSPVTPRDEVGFLAYHYWQRQPVIMK